MQVGRPLDYETASSHTVKVVGTDPSGAKDEITVTVNVTNVDEAGKITLMWKPASGSGVQFEAKLTDPDGVSGTTYLAVGQRRFAKRNLHRHQRRNLGYFRACRQPQIPQGNGHLYRCGFRWKDGISNYPAD